MGKHTPGPWGPSTGDYGKGRTPKWAIRKHLFEQPPYEGELENEWGIYPPLGEAGPVALVAGEENAQLIAAAPDLLAACKSLLAMIDEHKLAVGGCVDAAREVIAKAEAPPSPANHRRARRNGGGA